MAVDINAMAEIIIVTGALLRHEIVYRHFDFL
jgi:hypothetical protein